MSARGGGRVRLVTSGLVLVCAAALVVAALRLYDTGRLNPLICGGACGPEAVAAPDSLRLSGAAADGGPTRESVGDVDEQALADALQGPLGADALGVRVGLSVVGADGTTLYEQDAMRAAVPASTTKIVVAFAALQTMEPQTRFSTRTVLDGDRVVLVGGGDPYLTDRPAGDDDSEVAEADLETLAEQTATSLAERDVDRVSLGFDAGLFAGPSESPGWEDFYVPQEIVTPVSALWIDRGISDNRRTQTPARAAGERFAALLRDAGVEVESGLAQSEAPRGAPQLGSVQSATLAEIVDRVLRVSDNEAAEVLLRHVGIAAGRDGSFADGAAAVQRTLESAGVPTDGLVLTDGSGLARENRIAPSTLARVLQGADARASTSRLLGDLPVAGVTGTLDERYRGSDPGASGAGVVRAKTGTLTGVHSLAGYTVDQRGVPMYFAVMADQTGDANGLETQDALDRIAAAIAACDCG